MCTSPKCSGKKLGIQIPNAMIVLNLVGAAGITIPLDVGEFLAGPLFLDTKHTAALRLTLSPFAT